MRSCMHFTNENILQIAMRQSAIDANCHADDFLRKENVVVPSVANPQSIGSFQPLSLESGTLEYIWSIEKKSDARLLQENLFAATPG